MAVPNEQRVCEYLRLYTNATITVSQRSLEIYDTRNGNGRRAVEELLGAPSCTGTPAEPEFWCATTLAFVIHRLTEAPRSSLLQ